MPFLLLKRFGIPVTINACRAYDQTVTYICIYSIGSIDIYFGKKANSFFRLSLHFLRDGLAEKRLYTHHALSPCTEIFVDLNLKSETLICNLQSHPEKLVQSI
jgi:hypothetical protein